jgi:hypothetical protein
MTPPMIAPLDDDLLEDADFDTAPLVGVESGVGDGVGDGVGVGV